MTTTPITDISPSMFSSRRQSRSCSGFSLIEVTIALGIVAFAFVTIFGLIPIGLNSVTDSIDRTQVSQITQRLVAEAQQTPYNNLDLIMGQIHYFDGDGQEMTSAPGFVYTVIMQAVTEPVKTANTDSNKVGLSAEKSRMILVKISKHRDVTTLGANERPFSQTPFAIADVKL